MSDLEFLSETDLVSLLYSMNTAHMLKERSPPSIPADDEGGKKDQGLITAGSPHSPPFFPKGFPSSPICLY